ncbi:hypothetical protein BDR04DRAFT_981416, partial [Suillus decipiens]
MHSHPIFKLKQDHNGAPAHFKAQYACNGYSAIWKQDYTKASAPTVHMESFHVLAHLGATL